MSTQKEVPATYDVLDFSIREITECGRAVRTMGVGASSMEEVAGRIVRYLYDTLVYGPTKERACTMIRFFKTEAYEQLNDEMKSFARNMLGENPPSPEMKCLTLLSTIGENEEWNSIDTSKGHKAIPLPSEEAVHQIPMVSTLIKQFGLNVRSVINPDPALLLDMGQKTYGVFFVSEALDSPYIPAQKEFVIPYHIKSVLGFGGILPSQDLFVIIMFTRVPISRETAKYFENLSLNIKLAILPFEERIFAIPEKTELHRLRKGE